MAVTKTLQRNQEAISFIPLSSSSAKLQRNYNYSYCLFELEIDYTCSSDATFKYLNFANLIKNFQIFANGSTEYKNQSFSQLVYQTYILTGGRLLNDVPSLTNGPHKHTLRVIVPFASLLMAKPSDTGLLSNQFQTLDYSVNWNDASAVGTNITINAAQLKPSSFEKIESITQGEAPASNIKLVQKLQSEQILTTTSGHLINLPALKQYQNIQFDLLKGDNGDSAPDTVKGIKFLDGVDVVVQLSVDALKAVNKLRYKIDDELFCKVYATEISKNQVLNPKAHFMLNFSDRGHYTNSLSIKNFKSPQISLDTDISSLRGAGLIVNLCNTFAE